MNDSYLVYLSREHARLEAEIEAELKCVQPDEMKVTRLKKLKLALKDQIACLVRNEDPLAA